MVPLMSALFHSLVIPEGAAPTRWALFLHGLFGSGANWRGIARKLLESCPGWGAILMDLPMHGQSQGFPPPYTLAESARLLHEGLRKLPAPVEAILGHSLGGKIALSMLAHHPLPEVRHLFVLDSTPSARPDARGSEDTVGVFRLLESMPSVLKSKADFLARCAAAGLREATAQWLAMNLRAVEGGVLFRLDLAALRQLLEDYLVQDLWEVVERPRAGLCVQLVVGERSAVVSMEDRSRMSAVKHERSSMVILPGAGHWVHVDAPEALLRALVGPLSGEGAREAHGLESA